MNEAAEPRPVKIQLLDKRGTGPLITFRAPVVRIGRDPGCEIRFDDPAVSRVHCAIHAQANRAMLVVGHSRNPTLVNGIKASNVELEPGDEITVCDYKLCFSPTLESKSKEGPRTLDHRAAARPVPTGATPDPLAPVAPAMPEISLDGLDDDDDDEDSLDLVPNAPVADPLADDDDSGRPDDQHTQVLPRGKPKGPANGPAALGAVPPRPVPPGAPGAVQLNTGGRNDGQHTRVLPRGGQPTPTPAQANQAMILSDPSKPPSAEQQPELDDLDPQRLSVAIQEATDGMAGGRAAKKEEKRSPLKSTGVRAAMLLVMLLLALWAWKDALVPSSDGSGTYTTKAGTGGGAAMVVVGDRAGRSDEELRAAAEKHLAVGTTKLEEHHLEDGNLTMAIQQLRTSRATLQLLENPGTLMGDVEDMLSQAEDLRDQKHRDALFHYEKLKRSGDFREGQSELEFIMRLIDDEQDERFQYAAREMAQIEQLMKDTRR